MRTGPRSQKLKAGGVGGIHHQSFHTLQFVFSYRGLSPPLVLGSSSRIVARSAGAAALVSVLQIAHEI